jgi:hypothetical protein
MPRKTAAGKVPDYAANELACAGGKTVNLNRLP